MPKNQIAPTDGPPPNNPRNIFREIITEGAVRDILTKQVEKARAGDSSAAGLILKIALAKSGKNKAPRKNPAAPLREPAITKGELLAMLTRQPGTITELATRSKCDPESIVRVLGSDQQFRCDSRGVWCIERIAIAERPAVTRGQLLSLLDEVGSMSIEGIVQRTGCSRESVAQLLDNDSRFICNSRGAWSLDGVPA